MKEKKILFNSINQGFQEKIMYRDLADLSVNYERTNILLNVNLFFDVKNKFKLAKIAINSDYYVSSFDKAVDLSDEVLSVLVEKYSDYDSVQNNLDSVNYVLLWGYGKSIKFFWLKIDGTIQIEFDYHDFFNTLEINDKSIFSDAKGIGGNLGITIYYTDKKLSETLSKNTIDYLIKLNEKDRQKVKKKF